MKKKVFSIALVICLLLSMVPMTFASTGGVDQIILAENVSTFSIAIQSLTTEFPVNGQQFALTVPSGITASTSPTFAQGIPNPVHNLTAGHKLSGGAMEYQLGFFTSTTQIFSGTMVTLQFTYTGSDTKTIRIDAPRVVTLNEDKSVTTTITDGYKEIVVSRQTSSGNPGGDPDPTNPGGDPPSGGSPGGGSTIIVDDDNAPPLIIEFEEDDTPLAGNPDQSLYFDDVGSRHNWAIAYIDRLYELGVVAGSGNRLYNPGSYIKRADFVIMLVNAFGLEAEFTENFTDVSSDKYYYDFVGVAKQVGIIAGDEKGNFNPENFITRQEVMSMIDTGLEFIEKPLPEATVGILDAFPDKDEVSNWAQSHVERFVQAKIAGGRQVGESIVLAPKGNTTRAEIAVILCKTMILFDLIPE